MPAKKNLTLPQGSTWQLQFTLYGEDETPLDLTAYSINSQARRAYTEVTASASFTCTKTDASNGVFTWNYAASQSAALTADQYHYDIEITSGSVITRIVQGLLTVTPEVTRI